MMRTFLLLLVYCFSSIPSFTQTVFISRDEKFNFQKSDFDVVGRVGSKLYTYRSDPEGYFLNAYNDSARLVSIIALDFFPKEIKGAEFFVSENKIFVFYAADEKGVRLQYAAQLDENARLIQKPRVVDSLRKNWFGENTSINLVEASADKSHFAIVSFKNNSAIKNLRVKVISNDLLPLSDNEYTIDNTKTIIARQIEVSNSGNVYFLGDIDDRYASTSSNIALWIFQANGAFTNVPVISGSKYISGSYIRLDRQKEAAYFAGFTSDRKFGNIQGAVFGSFGSVNGMSGFKDIAFDDELRRQSATSNKKKAFDDYSVRDIIVKNNGGMLLIGEGNSVTTRNNYNGQNMGYFSPFYTMPIDAGSVEYNYGNILTMDADNNGTITWSRFIHKEQVSQDDGGVYSSFGTVNTGGSLVFVFNDYLRNNSGVQMAAIDVDGTLQMQRLSIQEPVDLLPRLSKQTGNRECIIPYTKKGSVGVIRLVF